MALSGWCGQQWHSTTLCDVKSSCTLTFWFSLLDTSAYGFVRWINAFISPSHTAHSSSLYACRSNPYGGRYMDIYTHYTHTTHTHTYAHSHTTHAPHHRATPHTHAHCMACKFDGYGRGIVVLGRAAHVVVVVGAQKNRRALCDNARRGGAMLCRDGCLVVSIILILCILLSTRVTAPSRFCC